MATGWPVPRVHVRVQALGLLALSSVCSTSGAFESHAVTTSAPPVATGTALSTSPTYRKKPRRRNRSNTWTSSSCLFQAGNTVAVHDEGLLQQTASRGTNSLRQKRNLNRTVLLVSLPPKTDDALPTVRRAWQWKDSALGDGRDYFVPRPRALRALNKLMVGKKIQLNGEDYEDKSDDDAFMYTIEECGVLSNCARLDVVLVVSGPSMNGGNAVAAGRRAVAEALASQLVSYGAIHQRNAALDGLASFLDLSGVVDECPPSIEENAEASDFANELDGVLVTVEGGNAVCRHMCGVACGLAARPSRPGRDVPFRPWSSRDAHIMLQLKRTSEVANGSRVQLLFDASLTAGKAARDPDKVKEILPLKPYGTDGRYALSPPKHLTENAVAAAMKIAIQPAVERCEAKLMAMDFSEAISSLRSRVEETLQGAGLSSELDNEVGLTVRRLLHRPIMALREGKSVDEDEIISGICGELGFEDPGLLL